MNNIMTQFMTVHKAGACEGLIYIYIYVPCEQHNKISEIKYYTRILGYVLETHVTKAWASHK